MYRQALRVRRLTVQGLALAMVAAVGFVALPMKSASGRPLHQLGAPSQALPIVARIPGADGASIPTAGQRLADSEKIYDLGNKVKSHDSARYGGIYVDADGVINTLIVSPDATEIDFVKTSASILSVGSPLVVRSATFTEDALATFGDRLDSALLQTVVSQPMVVGPNTMDQTIGVQVLATAASAAETVVSSLRTSDDPSVVISTFDSSAAPHFNTCDPVGECSPPLRGGSSIFYGGQGFCTGGFIAHSYSDSKYYLLTAGHCLTPGSSTSWTTPQNDQIQHVIGAGWNDNFPGGDAGIISINKPEAPPNGWGLEPPGPPNRIEVYDGTAYPGGSPAPTQNFAYEINHSTGNSPGSRVCMGGYYSACGQITGIGQHVTGCAHNGQCGTVNNEAVMNAPSAEGQSGSPMFASGYAKGILSAGGTFNGVDSTYYTGSIQAQADLNVYILLG